MSAGHIVVWLRQHTAFTILDASRKVLVAGEFWHADTDNRWDSSKDTLSWIRPIPTREKHPQTNGKIEKFFDCYDKHKHEFGSLEEFVDWYNNIIPRLDTKWYLQTPEDAFWGRLPE